MRQRKFIVLFDIDGTLVSGPRSGSSAGLRAMNGAAEHLTGSSDLGDPREFAGRTDPQIARMLLAQAGQADPAPAEVERLLDSYLDLLETQSARTPYVALGRPESAVRSILERGGEIGLGTGNLRRGAAIKLRSASILHLFDLDRGGYGGDGLERSDVLRAGIDRIALGERLPVIVVGDTPHDVTAAHAVGASCIGVPFGGNSAKTLGAAGCDHVVDQVDESLGELIERCFL